MDFKLLNLFIDLYLLDPLRTQIRIEEWLRSSESDETLLLSLEVIIKRIREQTLIDF